MRAWWIGVVAALPVFVLRAWPSLWSTVDDAWISARYAWHAAEGHGLVYNAGEPPVEGYTNLVWTLWLAVGHLIGAAPVGWMAGSGLAMGALAVLCAGGLVRSLTDRWWAPSVAAWALALDVHHAVVSTNGLESSQFLAAVLAAAWATFAWSAGDAGARWGPALGVGLGSLGAIRPEGFVIGGLLLLAPVVVDPSKRHDPRGLSSFVLPAVAVWAALEIWRVWTYGALVPNTFAAKATGGLLHNLEPNLVYVGPDAPWWIGAGLLGLGAIVAGGLDRRRLVVCAMAGALLLIALRVQMWMPGGRLLVPVTSLLFCLVAAAPGRAGQVLGGLLILGSLIAPFTPVERVVRGADRRHSVELPNETMRAGQHLAAHAPAGSWLAVRDAGVLAAFVGTGVKVAELHDRALTQPHPDGRSLDVRATVPRNPAFIALTQAREDASTVRYGNDRKVFSRANVPYVYLGRVYQHYHRYYDLYARADLGIPPLPPEIVVNRAGPAAPGG